MAISICSISLISLIFSINFIFLSNTYANVLSFNNDIHFASTNETFTETESRITSFVLDHEEETAIITNNKTAQEAITLQNQASYIENVIKTKFENKSSYFMTLISDISQFYNLRNNYLSEWENIPFQSSFDTFIKENSA
jgi:hypothetical protein